MDNNEFDDIIKGKVGEYHEPGFDPAALSDLHYRLSSGDAIWPWYSRYRTELFTGTGLILCTLLILMNQWYLSGKEFSASEEKRISSFDPPNHDAEFEKELDYLRNRTPDTIRVIEYKTETLLHYKTLLSRIKSLEATLENSFSQSEEEPIVNTKETSDGDYNFFYQSGGTENGRLTPKQKSLKSIRAQWNDKNLDVKTKQQQLSTKAIRDIENHYQRGIGIRVGPTLEASKGIYSIGNGGIEFAGGLLADFTFSPSISLETGGKFVHRFYNVSDPEDLGNNAFPGVEPSLGTPKNVDIDSWVLEVPVNLKYRYPISLKRHWLAGVGFSTMLYNRQVLEYDYELVGNPAASAFSTYKKDKSEIYPGTLNFIWGISNETKNKNILEASVYYQQGLSNMGVENVKQNFLGVRSIYWFKVR